MVEVDLLQDVPTVGAVAGGDVMDADAQGQSRIRVGCPGQRPAPPRPVLHVAALDVTRADGQVGAAVDRLQQKVQLLGRVAAVRVHLDKRGVVPAEPPGESGQVRRAQTVLDGAVHDVEALGVRRGQFVG